MTWPNDRQFVDKDGKILNHWMGQLQKLSPLLELNPQQFTALLSMIGAFLNPDSEADPGAAINLALPIDNEPLAAEDWLIEFKNSAQAGRRVPISSILALIPSTSRTLISTTSLTGSSVDIPIPSGYRDIELRIVRMGFTGNCTPRVGFSENGGATLVDQAIRIFHDSASYFANTTGTTADLTTTSATSAHFLWGRMFLLDYTSPAWKSAEETTNLSGLVCTGGRLLTSSSAPINLVRYGTSANAFNTGYVEVWGIP